MKVILLENLRKIGNIGDIIEVKRGFARNFLIVNNKALYASIKPTEISKLIFEKEKIEIKPSLIQPMKEIKTLGTHIVKIDLHSEIQAEIKIKVNSLEQTK